MAEPGHWPWGEVFLARHGQTEWNVERRRQGRLDSPLTAAGRRDAAQIGVIATGLVPDGVFASPQGRAATTAGIVAEHLGIGVRLIDELAEIDHGEFAGLTDAEIDGRHPGELDRRAADKWRWRFPGGESYADADDRAAVALGRIAGIGTRRPLIVSHEMISRTLIRHLAGVDPTVALSFGVPHGAVLRVATTTGRVEQVRADTAPD